MCPSSVTTHEQFAFALELRRQLIDDVQRAIDAGSLPRSISAVAAARILIIFADGRIRHACLGRFGAENADALATDLLNVAIAGLQAGGVADVDDRDFFSSTLASGGLTA